MNVKTQNFFLLVLSIVTIIVFPNSLYAYSFNIDWIDYQSDQISVFNDFNSAGDWQSFYTDGTNIMGNGVYSMSIPPAIPNSSYYGLSGLDSGSYPAQRDTQWQYSARITDIQGAITDQHVYDINLMATVNENAGNLNPQVMVSFFDGIMNGVQYDNIMAFFARIDSKDNSYTWSSPPPIVMFNVDPSSLTSIDLKMDITNSGQTFTSFFRLDSDDEADWVQILSHDLPSGIGTIEGYGAIFPAVEIYTGYEPVPIPGAALLMGSGLIALVSVSRRKKN